MVAVEDFCCVMINIIIMISVHLEFIDSQFALYALLVSIYTPSVRYLPPLKPYDLLPILPLPPHTRW